MAKAKRASTKPSEAQAGGQFGFPVGAVVTITEAAWTEAEEAGEKFVAQGDPEDPVLKIVGEIEGVDEPRTVFLRAGKAARGLVPSKDGEYLDISDGSTATALSEGCNADIFLKSISDRKKHKKMAVPEELHDDGISAVLVGLQFVAGSIIVKREGLEGPKRPTLVAEEIIELPDGAGGKRTKGKSKAEDEDERPRRRGPAKDEEEEEDEEDEEEEEERPARRGKKSKGGDEAEEKAEQAIVGLLESSKYKKGLPVEKTWSAVYALVRDDDDKKAVMALVEDDDWLKGDRPWKVSGKGDDAVLLPV